MWLVVSCWWFLLISRHHHIQGRGLHPGLVGRVGGGIDFTVSWSCNTVCTFVNVHENTVDDTSVVVARSADESTLKNTVGKRNRPRSRRDTQTSYCTVDPRSPPSFSWTYHKLIQGLFFFLACLLEAHLRGFFVRNTNALEPGVCS